MPIPWYPTGTSPYHYIPSCPQSRQHSTVWSGEQGAALHQSLAQRFQRVPIPHESKAYNDTVAVWFMREKRYGVDNAYCRK